MSPIPFFWILVGSYDLYTFFHLLVLGVLKNKHVSKTVVTQIGQLAKHTRCVLGELGRQSGDVQSPAPPKLAEGC